MSESRKYKYKRKKDVGLDKFIIPFDIMSLTLFCSYVLSSNKNIRKSSYINMRNLFTVIHEDSFNADIEKNKMVTFIKRGLDARVLKNMSNPFLIMKYINGDVIAEDLIDMGNFMEISNEEVHWVNDTVTACLKNSFIHEDIDTLLELCIKYKETDYRDRYNIVRDLEILIAKMQNKFRKAKVEDASEESFTLKDGDMETLIYSIHESLTSPSNKLKTGMTLFNELLSGGFESQRVYCLFGLPGEGKTTTLTNLAYQIKMNNPDVKTKDPTKKPCIAILTMENGIRETVDALFTISTKGSSIKDFTPEEVIEKLRTEGKLSITDENPIDIVIKFKPVFSVDTSYLYSMVDDLEDDGYECICLIQDYIKRIKPVDFYGDMRIDLGNVINDFKMFAIIRDIPVITASQLNRDATSKIDEGRKAKKADLVRLLGRSNIGESMLVLENLDGAFMIAPEFDKELNKYLGIQRIKARYRTEGNRTHIYHPYDSECVIKLEEDMGQAVPISKDSLRIDLENFNGSFTNSNVVSVMTNTIKEVDDIRLLTDDNIFSNAISSSSDYMNVAFRPILARPIQYNMTV